MRVPSYRLHKPSGQARVIIAREHRYLGKHGTVESWEKYHQLVAEYLGHPANGTPATTISAGSADISVNELILAYWAFASKHLAKDGKPMDR